MALEGRVLLEAIVEETAKELYVRALKRLPPDVKQALEKAFQLERNATGKKILETILLNIKVAEENDSMVCQDTGTPTYMVKLGTRMPIDGAQVIKAINEGCKRATLDYSLRPNIVHPITRVNTYTNVGKGVPIICIDSIPRKDYLEIMMIPKGSGSENMSFIRMLIPAEGLEGVREFIISSVVKAGGNPCPPTVVSVGIGGSFDLCARLAKEAMVRPIGSHSPDPAVAKLEDELLRAINKTGIGPMGLGGSTTALAVHIEVAHTHITQLPVAVSMQCWAARRAAAKIFSEGRVDYSWSFEEK